MRTRATRVLVVLIAALFVTHAGAAQAAVGDIATLPIPPATSRNPKTSPPGLTARSGSPALPSGGSGASVLPVT
jgi:hypothetical protein